MLTLDKLESSYEISPDLATSPSGAGLSLETAGTFDGEIREPLALSSNISRSSFVDSPNTMGTTNLIISDETLPVLTRGTLDSSDGDNPTRSGRFYDDYLLSGSLIRPNQELTFNLNAHVDPTDHTRLQFDPYLQLVNGDTGEVIAYNNDSGEEPFYINSELTFTVEDGIDYILRATSYENNETGSYTIRVSDWYRDNLGDPEITSLARDSALDGQLSRHEMISIFRDAKDYSVIDGTELTDLRTLVSDRQSLMPEYVHNLSDKLVNGDRANQWWTGGGQTHESLGNLYADASDEHMEKLIGKWFLGLDRPTANSSATYRFVEGSLFQDGINENDVSQGSCADCYFLAPLAGTASQMPDVIDSMIIDNGDDTYTVRFYNNGVADYVTVDRYLPTWSSGNRVYVDWGGGSYNESDNELWAALVEKAYAQINESGWIGQDGTNSYEGIGWGWAVSISQITSLDTSGYISFNDFDAFLNAFNDGEVIYLSGGGHAYTVVDYDSVTQEFTIYNPWGSYWTENLNWTEMTNKFGGWVHSIS